MFGPGSRVGYLRFLQILIVLLNLGVLVQAEPAPASLPETEIVNHYLLATREQQSLLRGASIDVEIDAEVPKLNKKGKLHALKQISKLGIITYRALGFDGDNSVKKEVIARFLASEVQQAQSGADLGITPANYKFKYRQTQERDGRSILVFHLTPRKKEVGLFKGDLWLDAQTYMPLRESGRWVKTPSVFLTKMEFVRTYDVQDGVSVLQRLESRADTRLFGPVTLRINFGKVSHETDTETIAETSSNTNDIR
jgi:hypothetical protein